MRISRRFAYAAQMALVLLMAAALAGVVGMQGKARAPDREEEAASADYGSPPQSPAAQVERAGVLLTEEAAEVARSGVITGERAEAPAASEDLDRYGGQPLERGGQVEADGEGGSKAGRDARSRSPDEG